MSVLSLQSDPGDVVHLCLEALLAGHSVLVFCPSRSQCETSAQLIAVEFRRVGELTVNIIDKIPEPLYEICTIAEDKPLLYLVVRCTVNFVFMPLNKNEAT